MKKAKLATVETIPATWPQPPQTLGHYGAMLWQRIVTEHEVRGSSAQQMLCQACLSLDRAEELRKQIDRDGATITVRGALKDHPALRHKLANRAFVVKTLQRLGLDDDRVRKAVGRPPIPFGITNEDLAEWQLEEFDAEWRALGMDAKLDAAMRAWLAADPRNTREEGWRLFLAELHRRKEEIERASHGNRRQNEVLK